MFINYNGKDYFKFQTTGNSARFVVPFAEELCKGKGYDIGAGHVEWSLPGSLIIDPVINGLSGNDLPEEQVDYIFSSHCLEHCDSWIETLEHWISRIKKGGVLFIYLPDYSQEYWRPWNDKRHKHVMHPEVISDFLKSKGMNVITSGVDLNNSFSIVALWT